MTQATSDTFLRETSTAGETTAGETSVETSMPGRMEPLVDPHTSDTALRLVEVCAEMYAKGWASGTGGGMSIREGNAVWMAPSGVQKERLKVEDLFRVGLDGAVMQRPQASGLRLSACAPLFMHAFRKRGAGAVLHSHSMSAMLATLIHGDAFRCTHLEMMKGIEGTGYHDVLEVPIIENTAHECDLADELGPVIDAHPRTFAVLVRRHGVYVWGRDWVQAKVHAECYDYLFDASVRMHAMGFDARRLPQATRVAAAPVTAATAVAGSD